jgi:anti-sigma regulatory factor (Ser/Thr protein kinase)/anti-anti-sigma regulatory factor
MNKPINTTFVVGVPREITAQSTEDFTVALHTILATSPTVVILDCGYIDQVTSAHTKLLWQAHMECSMIGATVSLTSASYYVWKVLKSLDLDSFFVAVEAPGSSSADRRSKGSMESGNRFEREYCLDEAVVEQTQADFLQFLDSLGVPQADSYVLQTLFYEIATNIRIHSGLEPSQTVHFAAEAEPERILFTFVDSGIPFNPIEADVTSVEQSDARRNRKPLGLAVMQRLADRLDYRRLDESRNVLVVERKWRMTEWKKVPSGNVS